MKKILITGASGFLGWNLALSFCEGTALHTPTPSLPACGEGKGYRVFGTYHTHPIEVEGCRMLPLDLADGQAVRRLLADIKPDVIIHTAALTNPDACERDRGLAFRVNVKGTEHLVRFAEKIHARLIFISTDIVYDGLRGNYAEEDPPNPLNYYAETKLKGEELVAEGCEDFAILRPSLMYGWGNGINRSFTDWMWGSLTEGKEIGLFTDQHRTPLLVHQALEVIRGAMEDPRVKGLFHAGGGERINPYEFGLKFCEAFGLPQGLLKPIEMEGFNYLARRPKDCSLNSSKIAALLGVRLLSIEEGLQWMKQEKASR